MNARDGVRRLREERRSMGVCLMCGTREMLPGRKHCASCLNQKREYARKRLDRMMHTAQQSLWRDASDPPANEDDVFVLVGGNVKAVGYYNVTLGRWCLYSDGITGEITHWLDGPELPGKEAQNNA